MNFIYQQIDFCTCRIYDPTDPNLETYVSINLGSLTDPSLHALKPKAVDLENPTVIIEGVRKGKFSKWADRGPLRVGMIMPPLVKECSYYLGTELLANHTFRGFVIQPLTKSINIPGRVSLSFKDGFLTKAIVYNTPDKIEELFIWGLPMGSGMTINPRNIPKLDNIISEIYMISFSVGDVIFEDKNRVYVTPLIFGGLVRDLVQTGNVDNIADVDVYLYVQYHGKSQLDHEEMRETLRKCLDYDPDSWTVGNDDQYNLVSFRINGIKYDLVIELGVKGDFPDWSKITRDCTANLLAMTVDGEIFARPNTSGFTFDMCLSHIHNRLIVPDPKGVKDTRIDRLMALGYRYPTEKHRLSDDGVDGGPNPKVGRYDPQ